MTPPTCRRCHATLAPSGDAPCPACGTPQESGRSAIGGLHGPRLVGHFNGGALEERPLGPLTSVGRHPDNTLRLGDREVSKEHAVLVVEERNVLVRDLGSSNGTFVNGQRVNEQQLRDGDEVVFGSSRFLFRAGSAAPPEPPRGVTVVAGIERAPAILAQIEPVKDDTFRPADELLDIATLRADYEKLRIAHEFQRQTGTERDPQVLLEKILTASFQLVPADNGVIFLPEGEGLRPAAVKRREGQVGDFVLSETVLQQVSDTHRAVLTADAIIDERFSASESIVAQGIRSAMAVPLLSSNTLRGVLFVDSRKRANAFSAKDLKLLAGLAGHAAIALENVELGRKIEQEAVTRAELSRFLSPAVAEMVVQGKVELLRQGRLEGVTVLFADIRGFTSMAEHDAPQEVVAMLNAFFTRMADVVFRHEGNLDKFIGDCVMAVWGPPSSHQDDPARALRAGLQMQQEVALLNREREAAGRPPLEVGIGINTGQAVVGYMGSAERHEFTAIGDSVNTASRLCGMAQGGEVLATEATVQGAGGGFELEPLPVARVKGKAQGVQAYRVLSADATRVGGLL